jgi:hypothetical protein
MRPEDVIEDVIETIASTGTKEWNEALSKRLESVRSYLDADEWQKGISVYLRAIQGGAMAKLINDNLGQDGYSYTRGFIAALRLVISLPQSIEAQIENEAKRSSATGPQKDTWA